MKIPSNRFDRDAFYQDLIQRCFASRSQRIAEYERLRYYFLFGVEDGADPAIYNKIYPSIDTLVSFLFAVDTTRFNIKLGTSASKAVELPKVPPLSHRINDKWNDSNADITISNGVTWALVYNTMIVKLIQRKRETMPFLLAPHNFGVLDESNPMLDRQEAMCQTFKTTMPMLRRELDVHPNRESILQRISVAPVEQHQMAAGVQRVIVNSQAPLSGAYTGNINDVLGGSEQYRPVTQEEMIELMELWVWNDDAGEGEGGWQVVTMADPSVCIYDREGADGMFLDGEHPFTQLCPNPAPDYLWGYSEVGKLTKLQDLREHHLEQVTSLIDRNVMPDRFLQGQWGAVEEKDYALTRLGALLSSQDPTAKVTEFKPQIPTDLWQIIDQIDGMFDETISLNNLSKGRGDTGVRSKGQTDSLLRVGSSRPKKRALTIEDSLERIATLYLKLDQKHNPDILETEKGERFISEQFTKDFMVKVDAHSSSPVFVEDQKELSFKLFETGVIDGESLLDALQPQDVQILKEKYKVMQANKAKQAAEDKQIEMATGKSPLKQVK